MNRERAAELLPIITAFAEGKSIEGRPCPNSEWGPVTTSHFLDGWEFRIKPEPREFWVCFDGLSNLNDGDDGMRRAHIIDNCSVDCVDHWDHYIKVREIL